MQRLIRNRGSLKMPLFHPVKQMVKLRKGCEIRVLGLLGQ